MVNKIFTKTRKKLFEPLTDTIKNTSKNISKTLSGTSVKNNQALENVNNRLLEIMNDRTILASYLIYLLSKKTNPEKSTQFKLVKDSNSNRLNDLLIRNSIPFTLFDNLLTFRDTGEVFELKGDLVKMITNKNYKVDHASLSDKKYCMILQRK